jgi:hypothetical protein
MERLLSVDQVVGDLGTLTRFHAGSGPGPHKRFGKTMTRHGADRAAVVPQVLQATGVDASDADRQCLDTQARGTR